MIGEMGLVGFWSRIRWGMLKATTTSKTSEETESGAERRTVTGTVTSMMTRAVLMLVEVMMGARSSSNWMS